MLCTSVPPTIQLGPPEQVTLPAVAQRGENGEKVITLDFGRDVSPPTPSTSTTTTIRKSTSGRCVKRSNPTEEKETRNEDSVSDGYYPAYLFQNPPQKLKTDDLRRQALISMIETNKSVQSFFDLAKGMLTPLKTVLVGLAENSSCTAQNQAPQEDHAYTNQNA